MSGNFMEDMDTRSRELFRLIVENYLETGEPMGSRNLSRVFSEGLSAASVRNVMGDDMRLMIDANHGYDVVDAVRLGNKAADYDIDWFEEPVVPEQLGAYADVRSRQPIPVAGGETWHTRWGFAEPFAKRLVDIAESLAGPVTGGLGAATVMACLFFGAISGSGPATTAAVGMLMVPAMVKRDYDKSYASAVTAASGGLGIIIPPSIPLVIFGISAMGLMAPPEAIAQHGQFASFSIPKLFVAGVVPGFIMASTLGRVDLCCTFRVQQYIGSHINMNASDNMLA